MEYKRKMAAKQMTMAADGWPFSYFRTSTKPPQPLMDRENISEQKLIHLLTSGI